MNGRAVLVISSQTFKEAIRAKWLIFFSIIFFLLAVNLPTLLLLLTLYLPPDYLSVYLPNLITVSFPFIPLLALPLAAASIVEERESGVLQYILSSPISRLEYFLGRILGLALATSLVIIAGYGMAAAVTYTVNATRYGTVLLAMMSAVSLNVLMLGIGVFTSLLTARKVTAQGIAISIWLIFAVISNVGYVSIVASINKNVFLAVGAILLNPVESSRLLAIIQITGGYDQLGMTGAVITHYLGAATAGVLATSLVLWFAVFFTLSFVIFTYQELR